MKQCHHRLIITASVALAALIAVAVAAAVWHVYAAPPPQVRQQEPAREQHNEPVKWPYQVTPEAAAAFQAQHVQAHDQASDPARYALKLNQAIAVNIKSKPVHWQGHDHHLAEFSEITFHRDGEHLKAWLKGSITTFDDVNYRVSIAVFEDAPHAPPSRTEPRLLGAATATCEVQRIWMGYVIMMPRTLEFDFDLSQAFDRATSFSISISERPVLTPDDWQKNSNDSD